MQFSISVWIFLFIFPGCPNQSVHETLRDTFLHNSNQGNKDVRAKGNICFNIVNMKLPESISLLLHPSSQLGKIFSSFAVRFRVFVCLISAFTVWQQCTGRTNFQRHSA